MVGDQKQLGPTYGFDVTGPTSLFARLIQAGHPHSFLDTQYRMHETLMQVPNMLFYDNMIKCGYVGDREKMFLYAMKPFLFIDVKNGREKIKGTSFCNFEEVETTVKVTDLCIKHFRDCQQINIEVPQIPTQRFTRNDIYVITPYNAQKNAIAERFA